MEKDFAEATKKLLKHLRECRYCGGFGEEVHGADGNCAECHGYGYILDGDYMEAVLDLVAALEKAGMGG